ncbi:MAG: flagellar hook-associated protein FlgK [Desulfobacterales bacterium]|nr:flagellar hook-associated protein FlgK [Desulfobacterales bacterium]
MGGIGSALSLGKSSLLTGQKALEVVGNNIANVNTPGYSREVPVFNDFPTLMIKGVSTGRGAYIDQVERQHDLFLTRQIQAKNAGLGEEAAKAPPLAEIDRIIDISENGLAAEIDRFFGSWQDLSADPGSRLTREAVLQSGIRLTKAFARPVNELTGLRKSLDFTLAARVNELNDKFEEMASLNQTVANIESAGSNALAARDRRDVLLQEISHALGGTSIEGDNGMVSYFLINGLPVVQDQNAYSLSLVQAGSVMGLQLQLGSRQIAVTADNLAGEFGGLLTVRDQLIPGLVDDLDKLAYSLADAVNQVHQLGTGLDGVSSRDFFVPPAQQAGAATSLALAFNDYRQVAAGRSAAPGDNANALALSDLGTAPLVDGSQSFSEFYGQIASNLGMEVRGNELALAGNQDALTQLNNLRDGKVGVSLEEEMINLFRYQKSFEASVKFLSTVDEMMDSLLSIKR